MISMADRYKWEAETANGEIITKGADLSGCIRFSLVPADGVPLPRHDIVAVPMERRFCRNFIRTPLNDIEVLSGKFFWMDGSEKLRTSEDQTGALKPGDMIGKGVAGERYYLVREVCPDHIVLAELYSGYSKPRGMQAKRMVPMGTPKRTCIHCIVCADHRVWINYATGAVLITEKAREVYL